MPPPNWVNRDMTIHLIDRRQFLGSAAKAGMALAVASALYPPTAVQGQEPGGKEVLSDLDVQKWIASGMGPLWVAGRFLNTYPYWLDYAKWPPDLKLKFQNAGSEFKSSAAAKAIWETIPAPIRARGPEAVRAFLKGKDWSHFIPKSWGGPTTAENGIWWCSPCNKSLGERPMSPYDIFIARLILFSEGMRAGIILTVASMVKGGLLGIVLGALLACLEFGLQYAEGTITWNEMVDKIVETSIYAGKAGFILTGILLGITVWFPFLIPVLMPLIFVLQIVALLFLGPQIVSLAKGWWDVLDGEERLHDFISVVEKVRYRLEKGVRDTGDEASSVVNDWMGKMADRFGIDRTWGWFIAMVQRPGLSEAWNWFAMQTQTVNRKAAGYMSSLEAWEYMAEVKADVDEIGEAIAIRIRSEFKSALSTSDNLLHSISEYAP